MGCPIQGFESTAPWIVWPGTFSKRRAGAARLDAWGCLGQFNQFNRKGYEDLKTTSCFSMFLLHHDHHGTRMHSAASWTSAMVCMRCPPHRKWCCDEMIRGLILDSVCRGRPTTHWFHHKTWTNAGSGFLFQQKNWCNDFYSSPFYSSLDIHSSYHRFFSLQVPSADTQEIPGTCWLTIQVLLQMNLPLELGYKFVTKGRLISEVLESGGKLGRLGLVTWRWSLSLSIYIIYIYIYIYILYIYHICVCVEGGTLKGLQSITNQSSKVIQRQPNGQDKNGRWICYIWRKLTLDQNTLGWLQEATNVLWVGTRGFRHSNICFVSVRSKVATHTV